MKSLKKFLSMKMRKGFRRFQKSQCGSITLEYVIIASIMGACVVGLCTMLSKALREKVIITIKEILGIEINSEEENTGFILVPADDRQLMAYAAFIQEQPELPQVKLSAEA